MPKTKSNSGAKKRLKVTGTGRLQAKHTGMRHNLRKKTKKQKKKLNTALLIHPSDTPRMKKLLVK